MDKILDTYNYGICLFSLEILQDFLKKEKIRSKKLLEKFQKDKELYLTTQKEGIWLPIVGIDSGSYIVKLNGYDEPFDSEWEKKLEYGGFNLEISDNLCICDIGMLNAFDFNNFVQYEKSNETMDGEIYYEGFKYDIPSGKYLITVSGYVRKQDEDENHQYGFLFSLIKTDAFEGFQNPREDELYEFNIGWLSRSKEAIVYWQSEEEARRNELLEKRKYYAAIQSGNGDVCHLYMEFDKKDLVENSMINKCRVDYSIHLKGQSGLLYSSAEYTLYEEIRKRGKSIFKEVGKIIIK